MKVCLVCSSGGHLQELLSIEKVWGEHNYLWVTFDSPDARNLLENKKKYQAFDPTNRNIINLVRNFFLALKVLRRERPDVIISTGAGISPPFLLCGVFFGIKTIYCSGD